MQLQVENGAAVRLTHLPSSHVFDFYNSMNKGYDRLFANGKTEVQRRNVIFLKSLSLQ